MQLFKISIFILIVILTFQSVKGQKQINQSYYINLKEKLQKDSLIKEVKYKCDFYRNGKLKEQHLYAKYKNDSIDRFWRVGKCFHYYKNGQLKARTDVDVKSRVHIGEGISFSKSGDTLNMTKWDNFKGKTSITYTIFKQADLGRIYEKLPDLFHEIKFKKGIRRKKTTLIYCDGYYTTLLVEYYHKDGSVIKVKGDINELEEITGIE